MPSELRSCAQLPGSVGSRCRNLLARCLRTSLNDPGVAARYDEFGAAMFEPAVLEPAVDLLAELAGDGGALELAVGTGRVALPLAARGVAGRRHRAVGSHG